MPARNQDLQGSAPDKCDHALLLIDLINDLDFPEAKPALAVCAADGAEKILRLKSTSRNPVSR